MMFALLFNYLPPQGADEKDSLWCCPDYMYGHLRTWMNMDKDAFNCERIGRGKWAAAGRGLGA